MPTSLSASVHNEYRRQEIDRPWREVKPVNYFTDEFGYVTSSSVPRKKPRGEPPLESMNVPMLCPVPAPPVRVDQTQLRQSSVATSRSWKFKCPHCQQMLVLRCDGVTLQKHECGSIRIF